MKTIHTEDLHAAQTFRAPFWRRLLRRSWKVRILEGRYELTTLTLAPAESMYTLAWRDSVELWVSGPDGERRVL